VGGFTRDRGGNLGFGGLETFFARYGASITIPHNPIDVSSMFLYTNESILSPMLCPRILTMQ
jgi:hypothetical protein